MQTYRYRQVRQSNSLQVCKSISRMSTQGKSIHAALLLMQYTTTLNLKTQVLIRHIRIVMIGNAVYHVMVVIM